MKRMYRLSIHILGTRLSCCPDGQTDACLYTNREVSAPFILRAPLGGEMPATACEATAGAHVTGLISVLRWERPPRLQPIEFIGYGPAFLYHNFDHFTSQLCLCHCHECPHQQSNYFSLQLRPVLDNYVPRGSRNVFLEINTLCSGGRRYSILPHTTIAQLWTTAVQLCAHLQSSQS
jgi:hypothetical protein